MRAASSGLQVGQTAKALLGYCLKSLPSQDVAARLCRDNRVRAPRTVLLKLLGQTARGRL